MARLKKTSGDIAPQNSWGHSLGGAFSSLPGQPDPFLLKFLTVRSPFFHDTPPRLVCGFLDVSAKSGEDQVRRKDVVGNTGAVVESCRSVTTQAEANLCLFWAEHRRSPICFGMPAVDPRRTFSCPDHPL